MKLILGIIIFSCLSLPVFSQQNVQAQQQRMRNLGDSMDTVITRSNNNLRTFDEMISGNQTNTTFTNFLRRHETLTNAISESEQRLHFLIRSNSRAAEIKGERDNYDRLIRELEGVKSEYDSFARSAQ